MKQVTSYEREMPAIGHIGLETCYATWPDSKCEPSHVWTDDTRPMQIRSELWKNILFVEWCHVLNCDIWAIPNFNNRPRFWNFAFGAVRGQWPRQISFCDVSIWKPCWLGQHGDSVSQQHYALLPLTPFILVQLIRQQNTSVFFAYLYKNKVWCRGWHCERMSRIKRIMTAYKNILTRIPSVYQRMSICRHHSEVN